MADFLRQSGYRPNAVLGSGMEGTVIDLGDNLVAKIWHRRTASELQALQTFYEAVAHADASFDTPRIRQVLCLKGQFATVETLLSGRPLRVSTDSGSPDIGDDDVACVTDVLAALAAIEATADMGVLPILEDEAPFETEAMPFARSLDTLVERRVEKFREPLLARLPELDVVVFGALAVTVSPGQEFQKGLGGQRRDGDRDVAWEFDPHSRTQCFREPRNVHLMVVWPGDGSIARLDAAEGDDVNLDAQDKEGVGSASCWVH